MAQVLTVLREVTQPDGSVKAETVRIVVDEQIAQIFFAEKAGAIGLVVTPENGIQILYQ